MPSKIQSKDTAKAYSDRTLLLSSVLYYCDNSTKWLYFTRLYCCRSLYLLLILGKEAIYYEDGRTCYIVIPLGKRWIEAREYCQNEFKNGDLAAVSNLKIKLALKESLTEESFDNGLWIGGNKVDGQWQWSNGDAWDFESWGPGNPQPEKPEKNFIRMGSDHKWGTWPDVSSYFLCEQKISAERKVEDHDGNGQLLALELELKLDYIGNKLKSLKVANNTDKPIEQFLNLRILGMHDN